MASEIQPEPEAEAWFKSTHSAAACTCVEVRFGPDRTVQIRDSKDPRCTLAPGTEPVIQLSTAEWLTFLATIRSNGWAASTPHLLVARSGDDVTLECLRSGTALLFNRAEWQAFLAGVRDGEFGRRQAICRLRNRSRRPARDCTNKPHPHH